LHKQSRKFTNRHRFQVLVHTFVIDPVAEYWQRIPDISREYAAATVSNVTGFGTEYGDTLFKRNRGKTTQWHMEGLQMSLIHYYQKVYKI
jgi:hypothetical protein